MKAITVSIYKRGGESYANGGISDTHDEVLLVVPDGYIDVEGSDLPVVKIERNTGNTLKATVVGDIEDGKTVGPMMGGSYIACSDSRFSAECQRVLGERFYGAVALHDRFETPEQNRALSI